MTHPIYASPKEKKLGLLFACFLGFTLAMGFLPSVHSLHIWFFSGGMEISEFHSKLVEMTLFPIMALCFHFSIPKKARFKTTSGLPLKKLLLTIPIPILIALVFGLVRMHFFGVLSQNKLLDFIWVVFCIPIGEEFLFRGWLHSLAYRIFGRKLMSLSSPFPIISWVTSIAFALWHIQNYENSNPPFLLFQLLYTLFTGLWLSYLRWNAENIWICVLAHLSLNLAAILPLILCYN